MAQLLLSSILLMLSPLSSPLVIREALKLTTGVEVEALYVEPSDQFCLSVEDFAIVRSDLERGWEYCERRLEAERLAFFDHIRKLQTNHEAVHESYLTQRDRLKAQLITAQGEVSSLTKEIWWWRIGLVAVLSIGALTTAALLTP